MAMRIFRQGGRVVLRLAAFLAALVLACSMLSAGVPAFAVPAPAPNTPMKSDARDKDKGPVLPEVSDPACISSQPLDFEMSPNGRMGYVLAAGGTVCAVDLKAMKVQNIAKVATEFKPDFFAERSHPVFSPDGKALYVSSPDGIVAVDTETLASKVFPVKTCVYALSADGTRLFAIVSDSSSIGTSYSLRTMDTASGQEISAVSLAYVGQPGSFVVSYGMSSDGGTWFVNVVDEVGANGYWGHICAVDLSTAAMQTIVIPSTNGNPFFTGELYFAEKNDVFYTVVKDHDYSWSLISIDRTSGQVKIVFTRREVKDGPQTGWIDAAKNAPVVRVEHYPSSLIINTERGTTISYNYATLGRLSEDGKELYSIVPCEDNETGLPTCLAVDRLDGSGKRSKQRLHLRGDADDDAITGFSPWLAIDGRTLYALGDGAGNEVSEYQKNYTDAHLAGHLIKVTVSSSLLANRRGKVVPKLSAGGGGAISSRAVGILGAGIVVGALTAVIVIGYRTRKRSSGRHVKCV